MSVKWMHLNTDIFFPANSYGTLFEADTAHCATCECRARVSMFL